MKTVEESNAEEKSDWASSRKKFASTSSVISASRLPSVP